jgi:hypothetical protein
MPYRELIIIFITGTGSTRGLLGVQISFYLSGNITRCPFLRHFFRLIPYLRKEYPFFHFPSDQSAKIG